MPNEEIMNDIWTWNESLPEPIPECVQELISQNVDSRPNAQAVDAFDGTLTYAELDSLANRLARRLAQVTQTGAVVPLCFEKSRWTVVAILAVLKAGGAFVLLEVSQPEARLQYVVRQTHSKVICSSTKNHDLSARLVGQAGIVIPVNAEYFATPESTDNVEQILPKASPTSTCYVVFTSGSTGTPKGVVLSHSNICSAFRYQLDDLGFNSQSRTFDFASYAFDVAVHNVLATLVAGGCLCIPDQHGRTQDPAEFMAKMEVTIANLTPSFAPLIDPERVPLLRTLIFLGESLSRFEAQRWWQKTTVINTYGPAECTPISTIYPIRTDPSTESDVRIGSGVGGVSWVVDAEDHDVLCPPGQVGELLIEGPIVGQGYLNDIKKTEEVFIPSPSWLLPRRQSRLYKTGDLVVQSREDGSLHFVGRKDTQIKIHGQRVELGEVEHHVQVSFPDALQTIVEMVGSKTRPSLAAFVHMRSEDHLSQNSTHADDYDLRTVSPEPEITVALSRSLPSHMLPSKFYSLAEVPRTASGKVDRKYLRDIGSARLSQEMRAGSKRQPTTDMEQRLHSVWLDVLNLEPESLGLDDSFMHMGGDSLIAIRLVGEARRAGIQLKVADIFQHPTLEDQARIAAPAPRYQALAPFSLCETSFDLEDIARSCNVDSSAIEDAYPCTSLQEGMFSLAMQRPLDYICQLTFDISDLSLDSVKAAWEHTSRTTAILRTRIVQTQSRLLQVALEQSITWHSARDLQECEQSQPPIDFGCMLSRFTLVGEHSDRPQLLVISLHHSLYDAWSLDLIVGRARDFYTNTFPRPMPSQPTPRFVDFIKYIEQSSDIAAAEEFWRSALADTQSIQFPAVRSAQQLQVDNEKMEWSCKLPSAPAGAPDATTSTAIRAALAILLAQHTESNDVTFGAVVSGRNAPIPGIEEMIGPTLATLPVRVHLNNPEITVSQLLRGLQSQAVEMIPFEQIGLVQIAKLGEGPKRACDFQTLLVVQPGEDAAKDTVFGSWKSENEQLNTYALTLECFLHAHEVRIKASYSPRAIDRWRLDKMLGQLDHVLAQLIRPDYSNRPLASIDIFPERDKTLLSAWSSEFSPTTIQKCVHELIQEQARLLPVDHPAICSWDVNMTYRELDLYSSRLANHLAAMDIGSGTLVPICLERSSLPVITMLACFKAGLAFVPIDPSLPELRRQQILRSTGATAIIASSQYSELFTSTSCHVTTISLDFILNLPQLEPPTAPLPSPSTVAYVLFTSGTTGTPKGVTLEHGAVSSSCTAHGKVLDFCSKTRALQFSSYVFDACVLEILTTLIYGGCICIPTEDDKMSDLVGAINRLHVNWMCVTSSLSRLLDPASIPTVKTFVLGGEKVNSSDAEPWVQAGMHVFSGYGPTECCVFTALHDLNEYIDNGLIGKPVGCVAWLVDPNDHNRLAPVGGVGEFLVEGPTLARGYLNEDQKTGDAFVTDPAWSLQSGPKTNGYHSRRFYKTGDLVQYISSTGTLRYLGRKDTQAKVRGQRLELAEVEHHVGQCMPDAIQVIAETMSLSANRSSDTLVAFVQMRQTGQQNGGHELDSPNPAASLLNVPADVAQRISQRLPTYMIPTLYVLLAADIPRMAQSGKTNRARLREIAVSVHSQHVADTEASTSSRRQPSTEAEHRIQSLWARVLIVDNKASIGMDDSFFERGGDSIVAMKLVAEARKDDIALTVADVMRNPTIAAQADLQGREAEKSDATVAPFSLLGRAVDVKVLCEDVAFSYRGEVDAAMINDIYPCTPLQEGILSIASKRPGDYVLQSVLELADNVRISEFKKAWKATFRSTPALRTRIVQHAELGLVQMVLQSEIEWVQSEHLADYLKRDKITPMGLGQPLSRFALIGPSDCPHYFVWTAHHALYDGWSLPLVKDLVNRLYSELCTDGRRDTPALEAKAVKGVQQPFSAFVRYVEKHKGDEADLYWRTKLENNEASPFPLLPSNVREPVADQILQHHCNVSMKGPAGRHPATVTTSTLVHAALAILIGRYTNSSDVVFGTVLSGRNAPVPRITDIVGPTNSTIPLRLHVGTEGQRSAIAFLQDVAHRGTEDIKYEQMGLQHIARLSKDCERACQFQTLLAIQTDDDEIAEKQAFGTWRTGEQLGFATYAVTLEVFPKADGLRLRARFDSRIIDVWKMERVLYQLDYVMQQLASVASGTDRLLADIDLQPPEDRAILQDWNGAPPHPAVERCLHEMIGAQAQTRPMKTAITGWDGEFTYEQLDTLSDRLGAYLASLGARPETMVPLCFPKSTWTPVAMLSVLKSGAAFVLMDPNHPDERLRLLCEKTSATVAVAAPETADRIRPFVDRVIILDQMLADGLEHAPSQLGPRASPNNVAYVIFTSGSTGVPKGCKIEHRSFASAAMNHAWIMGMSPNTRSFQFGSYIFAGALLEILLTLIYGGTVCVPSDEERLNRLDQAICGLKPNWAFFTPSVLSSLSPEMVPSLETICIGGEAIYYSQIAQWSRHLHLRQTYGSAETGAVISSAHLTEDMSTSDVGIPTAGRYWIVDASDVNRLAPLGSIGEVIIEGPSIGREYLDEPEKSAAAFLKQPAWRQIFGAPETGSRFYKTGDLATYTEQRAIRLLGRKDTQVKLRGQRIELGEIEEQARSASRETKELAVELAVPRDSDLKGAMLVAYVVLRKATGIVDQEADDQRSRHVLSTLRDSLQRVLPQHMVPTVFIALPELPKTISKKIDRKSLRAMASTYTRRQLVAQGSLDEGQKRQPTTDRERRLQAVWSRALNVESEKIGLDDDFFQAGGDSISALTLVAEARRTGFTLTMADVLKQRTLAGQARVAVADSTHDDVPSFSLLGEDVDIESLRNEVAIMCDSRPSAIEDVYPCTPLQEGLLSLSFKNAGDYVLQSVIELSSDANLEHFKVAWEQTVSAVAILRTRIVQHGRLGNVQVVLKDGIEWQESTEDDLELFLAKDKTQPVVPSQPLSRFTLLSSQRPKARVFVWTAHHALYDGWSLPLVIDLVKAAYVQGTVPDQKKFSPFIKYLQDSRQDEANAYWDSALQDFDSPSFPTLPSSTYKPTSDKTVERFCKLQAIEFSESTPPTLIRAALGILISQHSASHDTVYGAVVSGRNAPVNDIEKVVGPTIATVPVRVRLSGEQLVSDYLHTIQQQALDMIKFEQTGVQNIAQINKKACEFQTLLVIQPAEQQKAQDDKAFGKWLTDPEQGGFTTYALTIQCSLPVDAKGIHIHAAFDATVISSWDVSNMLDQFTFVLQQLAQIKPEQTVSDIELLTPEHRISLWSARKTVPQSVDECIHDLIRQQVRLRPNAIALSSWDGEMTYLELDRLSDQLAQHLTASGAKPGDLVPLCFEKSLWTSVAAVGCMKAGVGSLTVDTTQPIERLKAIVQQIDARFGLSSVSKEKLASAVLPGKPIFVIGQYEMSQMHQSTNIQLPTVSSSSIVCILSTSGSTGVPKCIAMTHSNFATGRKYHASAFGHGPGARVFAFASYSFDISWFDRLHSLTSGSTLCIPSEDERKDDLEGAIARSKATTIFTTPSVARLINPEAVPSIRFLILAGEPQRWSSFQRWPDTISKITSYGPAECTVNALATDARILENRDLTLGADMGANPWLVDPATQRLSALGTVGEIWLEGPLVGAGYLGDQKRSAASFVEDPSWLLQGCGPNLPGRRGRVYRTGDLARYMPDGSMVFAGRIDTQVKISGQRVELGEVEHHVCQVMGQEVEQAVAEVISFTNQQANATLIVFLEPQHNLHRANGHSNGVNGTTKEGKEAEVMTASPQVVDQLSKLLPSFMVPRIFFKIHSIPRNANGKTDRARLRRIAAQFSLQDLVNHDTSRGPKTQPTNATESQLQSLWAKVLNVEIGSIGLDDNFFQLGADSITAMKLIGQARKDDKVRLTVADIFRLPTLRELAALQHQTNGVENGDHASKPVSPFSLLDPAVDIQALCVELQRAIGTHSMIEDAYPCTPLQEGLLSLTMKHSGDYVLQSVLELSSPNSFDLGAFQAAWSETVLSTDVLRTRVVQHDQLGLIQVLLKDGSIAWDWPKVHDLETYLQQDKVVPMDLGQPLTRFAIIRDEKSIPRHFLWTLHHALYDGWSLPIIIKRASETYLRLIETRSNGAEIQPQPPPQFSTFVQHIEKMKGADSREYWRSFFAGNQAVPFPSLPGSVSQPIADGTVEQECSLPAALCESSKTTTSTLVRAAVALMLARQTGVPEAVFGAIVSGRNAPVAGIEDIVGPTIANVPVRIQTPAETTVSQYMSQVQEQATNMIPHEQTGLQNIARLSVDAQNACGFQTLLVVQPPSTIEEQNDRSGRDTFGIWRTKSEQQGFTTFGLTIECFTTGSGLEFQASFDSRILGSWRVQRLLTQLSFLTQQLLAASSETKIADVQSTPSEDIELFWKWNSVVPTEVKRCVHEIIVEEAREHPESLAVYAWDGQVTYRELDDLSEELAHTLVAAGVTPGTIVPLCFEKSLWTTVALLATLKAGGAFVFLDAETQPESRLRTITEQTKARVICSSVGRESFSRRLTEHVIVVGPETILDSSMRRSEKLPIVDPSNLLYLVFTSGSTGAPKGALVPHKSFASALHHQFDSMNIDQSTRLYDFASYSFDVSIHNVLATLAAGGCLCVPSESDRKSRLAESMEDLGANYANLTSSVARLIDPDEVPTLKTLTLGGEPVTLNDAKKWWGRVKLINSCGPAECTPLSVINDFAKSPAAFRDIGHGRGNLTWIVDPQDHNVLVPAGQTGELVLEGPLLGYGYLNDQEKTDAAFINDPTWLVAGSASQPGRRGRVYKSGDLARYNEDGSLQIEGRKDLQVKVRGQRVELEEIDHHLRRGLPSAEVLAETVAPTGTASAMLVAFLCLGSASSERTDRQESRTTAAVDEDAMSKISSIATRLDNELSKHLPPYMVPSIYVPVEFMPMTATSKINRRQLRALVTTLSREKLDQMRGLGAGGDIKVPPETKTGQQLQALWSRLLKVPIDHIGKDDSFFRLGGDSIAAMKLVGEARKTGLHFTVADVFRQRSIAGLVERQQASGHQIQPDKLIVPKPFELIDVATSNGVLQSLTKQNADGVENVLPLTDFQSQSISYGIAQPHSACNYFWLDLGAAGVDLNRLKKSCQSLLNHYAVLRSVFVPFEKTYWQVVLKSCELSFTVRTVEADLDTACTDFCSEDSRNGLRPGKLATSFTLLQKPDQGCRLVLRLSHAQYDGVCLPIMWQSLADLYHGRAVPPALDFSSYLAYLIKQRSNSSKYWKQRLAESQASQVASCLSRDVNHKAPASKIMTSALVGLPPPNDEVPLATLLGSAWGLMLSLLTEREDVVFGHVIAGREAAVDGIEDVAGPCVNVMPLRLHIKPGETTSHSVTRAVRDQFLSIQEHGLMMGWEDILRSCTDWYTPGAVDSMVQHQNIDEHPEVQIADTPAHAQVFENPAAFPETFGVAAYPEDGKLRLEVRSNTHICTSETAESLVERLCEVVSMLASGGDEPLSISFLDKLRTSLSSYRPTPTHANGLASP